MRPQVLADIINQFRTLRNNFDGQYMMINGNIYRPPRAATRPIHQGPVLPVAAMQVMQEDNDSDNDSIFG